MVSSGSRAMFSFVSLASLVLVYILAPSMLSKKKLQAFCSDSHTSCLKVIVLVVGVSQLCVP